MEKDAVGADPATLLLTLRACGKAAALRRLMACASKSVRDGAGVRVLRKRIR
jgi:hypothetical protein